MLMNRKFYFGKLMFLLLILKSLAACSDGQSSASKTAATSGAVLFGKNCVVCHGADGRLGLNGARDLSLSILTLEERINVITNGRNLMTPFGKLLSAAEIDSVAAFTLQLKQSLPK